jgi:hypothetical protein
MGSAFDLLLTCMFTVGCGYRALTERDVVGTYEANAQWGKSTLVLHPDHSLEQTVVRNDRSQVSTKGTRQLKLFAGKNASHGIIVLRPSWPSSTIIQAVPLAGLLLRLAEASYRASR